jgi:hypothetical protein
MPAEYPFKPPAFVMLTPSGRFETGVKICLSISSHHPESWQPSWSVRSALVALIAFMQTPGNGALGSLDHPVEVRRQLAAESRVAPPAYGSEERRELLRELHQRMLDMEERSRALCSSERAADAGPDSTPAAQSPDASAQPDEAAAAAGAEASSSAAAAAASGAVSEQQVQPAAEEAAGPVPLSVLQPPVTAASSLLAAALPAAAPPPPAPALATPAESELRQRVAAVAAAAAASPPPVPAPLPPLAVAHMAGPPQVLHADHSWEDRGLTYLAVVLALCIAALVVRKASASGDLSQPGCLSNLTPVAASVVAPCMRHPPAALVRLLLHGPLVLKDTGWRQLR